MSTPTVVPLSPAQFAALKRAQYLSPRELLAKGADHRSGSLQLQERSR